ncbi:MAG: GTP cyclohydrolase II [Myxococcota bacterium]
MSHTQRSTLRSRLELLANSPLPTRHGMFQLRVYRWEDAKAHPALSKEHCALVMGDVKDQRAVAVRVHSECLTSEVFGSLKCDCREQFERAQAEIARRGAGVLVYLRQEGRGIGLANKIRAYALQALGADTIEANELLHLPVDARTYDVAAAILKEVGVASIELLTNNPEKIESLSRLGVEVERRVPVLVAANPFSAGYLEVKRRRMQHDLPIVPSPAPVNERTNGDSEAPESRSGRVAGY